MIDDERQRFNHPDVELGPIVLVVTMDDSPPPAPPNPTPPSPPPSPPPTPDEPIGRRG